jgi:hypothetical protein
MAIFRHIHGQGSPPRMLSKTFWKDPRKAFEAEGTMEFAIRAYRAKTKKPLRLGRVAKLGMLGREM